MAPTSMGASTSSGRWLPDPSVQGLDGVEEGIATAMEALLRAQQALSGARWEVERRHRLAHLQMQAAADTLRRGDTALQEAKG